MRARRAGRCLAAVAALAFGASLGPGPAAGAETADPALTYEAWFFRPKPRPPQVSVPGQGPVSPGDVFATPNVPEGAYGVSSAGGQPGDGETAGDAGWAAFQWDVSAAAGGSIERFVVTFTQAPDARDAGTPSVQACNITEGWAGAPTSNPWELRPEEDCASPVRPTVDAAAKTYTFDVTPFAASWAAGEGFGFVIVPAPPEGGGNVPPFQLSLAGVGHKAPEVRPRVTFEYTAPALADFGGDVGGGATGDGGASSFGTSVGSSDDGLLVAVPDIDVNPTDVGSPPAEGAAAATPAAGGAAPAAATPPTAATGSGFPLVGWLLVPLGLGVAALTGVALGPAGDPTVPREGGVSRVLATRRATRLEPARS